MIDKVISIEAASQGRVDMMVQPAEAILVIWGQKIGIKENTQSLE